MDFTPDGRYVTITSNYYLAPGQGAGTSVFLHDLHTGRTSVVDVTSNGEGANGNSREGRISADGRYVLFTSDATNLAPGLPRVHWAAYLRDMRTGTTNRVAISSTGVHSDRWSQGSGLSDNGRYVLFDTDDAGIVPGDSNGLSDVFIRDMKSGTVARVSLATSGAEPAGESFGMDVSDDGRYVLFQSDADNLVPGDTNQSFDVFVRDMKTGVTSMVNVSRTGRPTSGYRFDAALSRNGRYVVFESEAADHVEGDTNGKADVFVRDLVAGTTTRVNISHTGEQALGDSRDVHISPDGRYVVFASDAANLVPGDTNGTWDVFLRDRLLGTTTRVSVASDGTQGNGNSDYPLVSEQGRSVVFRSSASNLVPGDTNQLTDLFVRARC